MWTDRIGLLLQFLAFWLIAPELVGKSRLYRLRRAVTGTVQAMLTVPIGVAVAAVGAAVLLRGLDEDLHNAIKASLVALVFLAVALAVYAVIRRNLLLRLAERLEDEARFRSALASIGAALFSIGFALQFVATFGKP